MGILLIRSLLHYAQLRGFSAGALFIDIVAAYESVVRQFVVSYANISPLSACAQLGLEAEDVTVLMHAFLSEPESTAQAGISGHLNDVLADVHTGTWFATEGLESVVTPLTGALPGNPIADTFSSC